MKLATSIWQPGSGWSFPDDLQFEPGWILYFGTTSRLENGSGIIRELMERYPDAVCCGCSTAGEILGTSVYDDAIVAALVGFDGTTVRAVAGTLDSQGESAEVAGNLVRQLLADDLQHLLVISKGLEVNGTSLLEGFRRNLPGHVAVTGGLAGDHSRFQQTLTGLGDQLRSNQVVCIGFYGKKLQVSFACKGGWEGFGPQRRVTRSEGNVLFELDGVPALAIYKRYLGERAAGLPATGLLFPLELTSGLNTGDGIVRTILSVNEADQSLTFAGDIPQDFYVRLMKASATQLIAGAENAGKEAVTRRTIQGPALAILISCVGRKLVLKQRVEEEVEAVANSLNSEYKIIGFYSYGEICPLPDTGMNALHNQTMTITIIGETG